MKTKEIKTVVEVSKEDDSILPVQNPKPDWSEVQDYAMQAAVFTMNGDIAKANDCYQFLAIEVMSTLYGPNAVANFLEYAMQKDAQAKKDAPRIVLS